MKKLYFFLCFTVAFQLAAQDSLARYTTEELGNKSKMAAKISDNPKLWKIYLDGMMRKHPSDSLKSNTLYDVAWEVYRSQDYDLDVPIMMLKQGLKYARKADSKPTMLYCLESLSTFYALKNDNNNSLKSIEEMKRICRAIPKNSALYVTFQASTARVYSIIGDFEKSISIVKKSNVDINNYISNHPKLPKDSLDELIWIEEGNYIHLAQSYNFQKQLDSAGFCIKKAKQVERKRVNKKLQNNIWVQEAFYLILSGKYDQAVAVINDAEKKGFIDSKNKQYRAFYYLAVCSYSKKEYAKSLAFCEKASAIKVKIASFMNFELEVYNLAALSAEKLGDVRKEIFFSRKYNRLSKNYNYAEKSRFISELYSQDVSIAQKQLNSEKTVRNIFVLLLVLVILVCIYLLWHYIKLKKDRKKFESVIASIKNTDIGSSPEAPEIPEKDEDVVAVDSPVEYVDRKSTISMETDERIIKQLSRFEKKEQFLSQNISLSSIARSFNTNPSYISSAIKKHKNKNFNGYINDLRIDYIVKKLKHSPEYLNYKIAYLAEECGFSSHTVFIRIFTEKTGLTPSKFINFLKNEQNK